MLCWKVQWLQMLFPLYSFPSAACLALAYLLKLNQGKPSSTLFQILRSS